MSHRTTGLCPDMRILFELSPTEEFSAEMPSSRVLLLIVLIFTAAFARLVPHMYNATPVAAVTLFAAAYLPARRWSVLLPFAAMFFSDLVLYATKDIAYRDQAIFNMLFVYSAFAGIALLGQLLRRQVTASRVIGTAVVGSILFFLVTNFGAWLALSQPLSTGEPAFYSRTLGGLIDCYIAGVPFFRGTFFGDLIYTTALFGGLALLERIVPQFQQPIAQPTVQ